MKCFELLWKLLATTIFVAMAFLTLKAEALADPPPLNPKDPETLWPRLICHKKWYDNIRQQSLAHANTHCRDETSHQRELLDTRVAISDWRGCILWRLRALAFNGSTPIYASNRGLKRSLHIIYSGLYSKGISTRQNNERKKVVDVLMRRSEKCAGILHDLAVVKKLPSPQWMPFYDCVENAWVHACYKPPTPPQYPPSPSHPPHSPHAHTTARTTSTTTELRKETEEKKGLFQQWAENVYNAHT